MPKKDYSALRDRVIEYIQKKGISVRAFEKSLGFPNGSIAQYTDNTSKETLKKINDVYPDFDIDYIITGRHEAVDTNIYKQPVPYEFVEALIEERKRHDDMNAELIRQNGELIELMKEAKKTIVHTEETATCADVKLSSSEK